MAWDGSYRDRHSSFFRRILNDSVLNDVTFAHLQPEAIGMMLNTLVSTFVMSFEEQQEQAICKLLTESTFSWRKFTEILAHMNDTGAKQTGDKALFANLGRINAILDGSQQRQLNAWVHQLATAQRVSLSSQPYQPRSQQQLKDAAAQAMIKKQIARLEQDTGTRMA